MIMTKSCSNNSPSGFVGHWRDWHRGHGCDRDDGKPRSDAAITEIAQLAANAATGYLTDAELSFLRARTTSGDTILVRALDELKARRAGTAADYFRQGAKEGAGRAIEDERVVTRTFRVLPADVERFPALSGLYEVSILMPESEHTQNCGQCGWSGTDADFHACPGLPGESTF